MSASHFESGTPAIVREFEAGDESLSFILRYLFEHGGNGQIDCLLGFLRRKFHAEERIMHDRDYPLLHDHRAAHLELAERLTMIGAIARRADLAGGSVEEVAKRETFLHVERFDMPLLRWLRSPRSPLSTDEELPS